MGETLSDFIHAQQRDIQGVALPLAGERDLVDQEYADDTVLMVLYAIAILDATRSFLDVYCFGQWCPHQLAQIIWYACWL